MVEYTVGEPWIVEPLDHGPRGQTEHIQGLNREHARKTMRMWIEMKRKMGEEIADLERRAAIGCEHCRGLPIGSGYDLKYGAGKMYGLDESEDELTCPKCERVVACWD